MLGSPLTRSPAADQLESGPNPVRDGRGHEAVCPADGDTSGDRLGFGAAADVDLGTEVDSRDDALAAAWNPQDQFHPGDLPDVTGNADQEASASGASTVKHKPGPSWLHKPAKFVANYAEIAERASPAMLAQLEEKMDLALQMILVEHKLADAIYELSKEELKQTGELDAFFKTVGACEYKVPEWCCPINADVLWFDFRKLARWSKFDVIVIDPPWELSSANPTRGVTISYQQLSDSDLEKLPLECLSDDGYMFIWTINAKYALTLHLLEHWGYEYVDQIQWIKKANRTRRIAKGHGFYLQHAKETLVIGRKGSPKPTDLCIGDYLFARRTGQSSKPPELYEIIEALIPNGKYLEIFGRLNNVRDYWVTIGNELGGSLE